MALSFNTVHNGLATAVSAAETALENRVKGMDPATVTPGDLLVMQQEVSKWSMMTSIQSSIVKELSDSMKSIIQKAA